MSRLISRQMSIPNGFWFYQPETRWDSRKTTGQFPSFDILVRAVIAHRTGNAALAQKAGWSLDFAAVSDEVDRFNSAVCQQMGWNKYILIEDTGGPPVPKSQPLSQNDQKQISAAAGRVRKIWAGVKTLNDWIDSGEQAVPHELAEKRAALCAGCPFNGQGDFSRWFTAPAAESIRRQMERVRDRKLDTTSDGKLNICEACLCPLKLKVHTPMEFIRPHTSPEVLNELKKAPSCWIISEYNV